MKTIISSLIYVLTISIIALGCSSTSTITANEHAISIAMGDTEKFNEALSDAAEKAEKHCDKYDKSAKLDRTEKAGKKDRSGVAYFTCEASSNEE